ncbi:MAG: ribosome biogenesis GTPase Der [bacterium]
MSLPALVIIGRPNVGKSSLFNRIIGRRQAIVDDQPGITRDRIYARGDWNGRAFALIDTGGLLLSTQDPLLEAVREQVEFAAEEAARILFLLDWETGVTDLDLAIAKYLHRLNKPITVVVNKADDEFRERDPKDFINLGFGDPIFVSAMRGRGIGELLDRVIDFPAVADVEETSGVRIAILGRPNVGKSSMVNAITGRHSVVVSDIPGTTRDAVDTRIRFRQQDIILVDTAGLKRRGKTKEAVEFYSQLRSARAMERADVVWIVLDAQDGLVSEDQRILTDVYQEGKGILLLMNKWDIVNKDNRTAAQWKQRVSAVLGAYAHLPLLFVSALHRQRLIKALESSLVIADERRRRIPTSELNHSLQPIIQRTPPPSFNGRFINIKYISQLNTEPPLFGFFCNFPQGVGTSYQRFMERTIRELYGFQGVPIRLTFRKK